MENLSFPGGAGGKEPACQCSRRGFNSWVRKIPWGRKWQPIPVIILAWKIPWTEESGGLSPWGLMESDTTEHTDTHNGEFTPGQLTRPLFSPRHRQNRDSRQDDPGADSFV